MKSIIGAVFIILFCPSAIFASPYLVCDPQTGVGYYKITGDTYWAGNVIAQSDGSIKSDVGTIAVGTHSINVVACKTDVTWGEVCSAAVPFSFTRPAAPVAPVNTKLAQ